MTGTEGLRQVKAEHPDLVILDLMPPSWTDWKCANESA